MSALETLLTFALAIAIITIGLQQKRYKRLHKRQMILRHLFIRNSDECANQIEKIVQDATELIVLFVFEARPDYSRKDALGEIYPEITNALGEWGARVDALNLSMAKYGMPMLSARDLDRPFSHPELFKPLPTK